MNERSQCDQRQLKANSARPRGWPADRMLLTILLLLSQVKFFTFQRLRTGKPRDPLRALAARLHSPGVMRNKA